MATREKQCHPVIEPFVTNGITFTIYCFIFCISFTFPFTKLERYFACTSTVRVIDSRNQLTACFGPVVTATIASFVCREFSA
jgi:hypothetical protein